MHQELLEYVQRYFEQTGVRITTVAIRWRRHETMSERPIHYSANELAIESEAEKRV